MRHETAHDRHSNIKNAIMATGPDGNSIYIDLITITDSSEENHANYQIKHGNYYPASSSGRATWDQFYIDGKDDGYPQGFQTLSQVERFFEQEIERLQEKITECIISNENSSDDVSGRKWHLVLEAWVRFHNKFLEAKRTGKLIDVNKAKQMRKSIYN
jgi:hypothetical protein